MRVTWFVAFLPWAASLAAAQWTEISGLKTKKMTVAAAPDGAPLVAKGDTVTVHATGIVQETDKKFWSTATRGRNRLTRGAAASSRAGTRASSARRWARRASSTSPRRRATARAASRGHPRTAAFFEIEVLSIKGKGPAPRGGPL
ncbi:peptidyl-prolyl cis-trans isomerase [Aureococcus anophagefferens]|nr:peptidyl-prolyl cis-trans isomerase [Aureococcus anophagefferens]